MIKLTEKMGERVEVFFKNKMQSLNCDALLFSCKDSEINVFRIVNDDKKGFCSLNPSISFLDFLDNEAVTIMIQQMLNGLGEIKLIVFFHDSKLYVKTGQSVFSINELIPMINKKI